jgi:hypothetical protein
VGAFGYNAANVFRPSVACQCKEIGVVAKPL